MSPDFHGKRAVLTAMAFGVAMFATGAVVNVPHHATDADLLAWWSESANRASATASGIFGLVAAALFTLLLEQMRHLPRTGDAPLAVAIWRR